MFTKPVSIFSIYNKLNYRNNNLKSVQNNTQEVNRNDKNTATILRNVSAPSFMGTYDKVTIKNNQMSDKSDSTSNVFKVTNEAATALGKNTQNQIDKAVTHSQKLFDELTDLYKKGEETAPDGTVLRKITGDTVKIMEEFTQNGKLVRRSIFIDDNLYHAQEGIEEFADGSIKIAKEISFLKDGTPELFMEGYKKLANGAIEAAKVIDFYNNGTLCTCLENIEQIVCGIQKVENINHFELTDKGWQEVSE